MKRLQNDKVLLRALEPSDINELFEWENDDTIWPFTSTYIPFNRSTLLNYAQSVQDIFVERQYRFVIESRNSGKAVGFIDLFDFDPIHQRAGVGILIAGEENRNKGFAKNAIALLKTYATEVLMLNQLFANITADNSASMKLFESSGFVQCGAKKSWHKTKNGFQDELMYQLIFNP